MGGDRGDRDRLAAAALRATTCRTDIAISRRPSGRPRLAPPYPELGVSLSRRGGLLLAGFSPTAPVGVDLELWDDGLDTVRLAADHFAPAEAGAVAAASSRAVAIERLLRLWVAKEAVLKATGRGIYDGLGAPDLASVLDALCADARPVALPSAAPLPAFAVAVTRLDTPSGRAFAALAVLAP